MKNSIKMKNIPWLKYLLTTVSITIIYSEGFSQTVLSRKEALEQTMENNFDIAIAKTQVEIADNNSSRKNNQYLPTLSAQAGGNYSVNTLVRPDSTGDNISIDGIVNQNYNASLSVGYLIFDGMGRSKIFKQLQEQKKLTELEARVLIENTAISLFSTYYEVARLTQELENRKWALDISKKRYLRATYAYEYGQSLQLDVLNAEVDLSTDSLNVLNAQQDLNNVKRDLNLILGRSITSPVLVDTTISYHSISLDSIENNALRRNAAINQANQNLLVSQIGLNVSKSGYVPKVSANASYGWNRSRNGTNPFFGNQTIFGPSVGVTMNWSIFDGGRTDVSIQNAKLNVLQQEINQQKIKEELKRDIANTWTTYQTALFTLKVQNKNLVNNQRNFERSREMYNIGTINSIEFRQAQLNLITAQTIYFQAKYNAKMAELNLLRLNGSLLSSDF